MKPENFAFTAVFVEEPEGGYSAYVEEIPGVNTQGESLDEARSNLQEALKMVLETNKILAQKNITQGVKSYREPLSFAE
jgi:predicted RNase H-like HicB family nuclease